MKLYTYIGIGVGLILLLVLILILFRRRSDRDEEIVEKGINVVIADEAPVEQSPRFKPIQLDTDNEKSHIEKEIRKYATEKPDQVAEIIKSWLAEDER